jgi:hypothetical protein
MKLSKLINEIASSRGGTVTDSFYSIANTADEIDGQNIGKDTYPIYVQRLGASADGKTTEEISVRYGDGHRDYFTIYDYKFGEDPTDEDNYQKEYPFSLGVPTGNTDALEWAKKLGFNAEPMVRETEENMEEEVNEEKEGVNEGKSREEVESIISKYLDADDTKYVLDTNYDEFKDMDTSDILSDLNDIAATAPLASYKRNLQEVDGGVEFFKRIAFKK